MSETLHTCPLCQRSGFTKSGLKSHRCKSASTEIAVEVVAPDKGALVQIHNVGNLDPINQIISAIRADHDAFTRHSKVAAFLALRIGLRLVWVKNNSGHGSLDPFIKEHLPNLHRNTLGNYIRIADQFVTELELRDKKTFKLTDASKIKPILDQQLELFTDPNAKLDIHCRQLVQWVDGRGLTQIYRDLGREDIAPPPPGPKTKAKVKTPEQVQREAFTSSLTDLKADYTTGKWQALFEADRIELEKWLGKAWTEVRAYNAAAAKTVKDAKKGVVKP